MAVVVASGEVPYKIAQIHIGELVRTIVAQVAHKGGVAAAPVGGIEGVVFVVPPHTGVQGGFFVLLAGDVGLEVGIGGGMAFVDGGSGGSADGDDEIGSEADEEEQDEAGTYAE